MSLLIRHTLNYTALAISLLEYLVLGLPVYVTVIAILVSSLNSQPVTKSTSGVRITCVAPMMIFSAALMIMDPTIIIYEEQTVTTFLNSTEVETTITAPTIYLQNMSWPAIHMIFFVIFFFYIIFNALAILKKGD